MQSLLKQVVPLKFYLGLATLSAFIIYSVVLKPYGIISIHQKVPKMQQSYGRYAYDRPFTFTSAIQTYADNHKRIILAVTDSGTLDMAMNLYYSSFVKLNITNYLLLGTDNHVCETAYQEVPEIHCFKYAVDQDVGKATKFISRDFGRKTHYKSMAVHDAILLGYNVLLTDIDIVWFKNPLDYFEKCPECDLQVQWDDWQVNSGFYYIRATKGGEQFTKELHRLLREKPGGREQPSFNKALGIMKNASHEVKFNYTVLPKKQFPYGKAYYEFNRIMFASDAVFPPPDTYIVHNNWIVGAPAKRYRFKESLMWSYDQGGYYSNPNAKYITYQTSLEGDLKAIDEAQIAALKTAFLLAHILGRIVILPTFSCLPCNKKAAHPCQVKTKQCSYINSYSIAKLDMYFSDNYREHMFLQNPLVPSTVRLSQSTPLVPDVSKDLHKTGTRVFPVSEFQSEGDIRRWFSDYGNVSILVFEQLETAWQKLDKNICNWNFRQKLKSAIKHSDYLQMH